MMSIALGDNNTGWCVDTQGQVWFCTNVTREHPFGQGMWYQVSDTSLNLYLYCVSFLVFPYLNFLFDFGVV